MAPPSHTEGGGPVLVLVWVEVLVLPLLPSPPCPPLPVKDWPVPVVTKGHATMPAAMPMTPRMPNRELRMRCLAARPRRGAGGI